MNVRSFLAIGLLALSTLAQAQLVEGEDYTVLSQPMTPLDKNKDKIEILEVFSYTCNHCRDLDPIYRKHIKTFSSDIAVRTEQVVWGDSDINLAKIASTVAQTKTKNQLNAAIFTALFDEQINLTDPGTFQSWLKKQPGIDTKNFLDIYNSFSTNADANRMKEFTTHYGINSTPRLIVGGKYQVTLISNFNQVMVVLDELIEKVRKERNMPDPKAQSFPKVSSPAMILGS